MVFFAVYDWRGLQKLDSDTRAMGRFVSDVVWCDLILLKSYGGKNPSREITADIDRSSYVRRIRNFVTLWRFFVMALLRPSVTDFDNPYHIANWK